MKQHRLITVLAAALVGVTAAAFPAAPEAADSIVAEAANGDTFYYGNYEYACGPGANEATLLHYVGSSASPVIDGTVYDWSGHARTVRVIGPRAFQQKTGNVYHGMNITSVTIPNTVREIDEFAFANTSLQSVVVPSSVTTIERGIFQSCQSLQTATIQGAVQLKTVVFSKCSALTNVNLHPNTTGGMNNFTDCSSLTTINNTPAWSYTLGGKPVFTNSTIKNLIRNAFKLSVRIKFVDDYCTALCDYVARTQTTYGSDNDWMCDAVKARQIHDWIAYHYEYEDFYENGVQYPHMDSDIIRMSDNQDYSSFFVSYGVDERGYEVGESVCAGIAKAYTMLLKAAGIESYVIRCDVANSSVGHAWNIIRIKEGDVYRYYQSDVGAGDQNYNTQMNVYGINHYGCYTNYEHFLVSAARYDELQGHCAISYSIVSSSNHPYFHYNNADGTAAMNQCNYNYNCNLLEGLLTGDWDFNGTVDYVDTLLYMYISYYYTNPYPGVSLMNAWFTDTVNSGMEPWDYIRWRIANS